MVLQSLSPPHVVIVGGGISGLVAAKELLDQQHKLSSSVDGRLRVTIVEQNDYLGGRIQAAPTDYIPGHVVDVGAEFIHGKGTMLTDLVARYFPETKLEEVFITAHADGGPSPETTREGKYGMYFVNGELHHAHDERLQPLERAIANMEHMCRDETTSLDEVFEKVSPSLSSLAVASYGNTVGCTNHSQVSLQILLEMEDYWQEHEDEGDVRLDSKVGMYGLVKQLVQELEQCNDDNVTIQLNQRVGKIQSTTLPTGEEESHQHHCQIRVEVSSTDASTTDTDEQEQLLPVADAVIVTVPPPALVELGLELPLAKLEALQYIGMDKAVKVMVLFHHPIWPPLVQSLVCANQPIPEIWFRPFDNGQYLAVGFLTSGLADAFLELIQYHEKDEQTGDCSTNESRAADIFTKQLAQVFSVPLVEVNAAVISHKTKVGVWNQGYTMYPKVGMRQHHLHDLAAPMLPQGIFFAGEATHTGACCTVQAAMETGARAAKQVMEQLGAKQCHLDL